MTHQEDTCYSAPTNSFPAELEEPCCQILWLKGDPSLLADCSEMWTFAAAGVLGSRPSGRAVSTALPHPPVAGWGHGTRSAQWLASQILIVQVWPPKALCSLLWPLLIFHIVAALSKQGQSKALQCNCPPMVSVIREWEITLCYCKLMRVCVCVCTIRCFSWLIQSLTDPHSSEGQNLPMGHHFAI